MSKDLEKYRGCLSHLAFSSHSTIGRRYPLIDVELEFDQIDPFLRDETAILESKGLRRLGSKTQVFTDPKNPHVRHRSDHTHEAAAAAIWIASLTGLNVGLCRSIALGHDLGHSPYGHLGERVISEITGKEFKHEIFGVVVAQEIERKGQGLNLSYEVLAGMRWHSGMSELSPELNLPLECRIGNFADKISYLFADVNDVKRLGFPDPEKVAQVEQRASLFGSNHRERTQLCIRELVKESAESGTLSFSKSEVAQTFLDLRKWMYQEIYNQLDELRSSLRSALVDTYELLSRLPYFEGCDPALLLALMTDREIDGLPFIIRNKRFPKLEEISHLGIVEIVPYLRGRKIDFTQIDLNPLNFRRNLSKTGSTGIEISSTKSTKEAPASLEIERKFLVKCLPDHWEQNPNQEILQGYTEINEDGSETRLRQAGNVYVMGQKTGKGKTRVETPPIRLTQEDFNTLWVNTRGRVIEKTRYKIQNGKLTFELDIYQGKHQGLAVVEVEFKSDQESLEFIPPEWFGEEITEDERYKNKNLAQFGLPLVKI